MNDGKMYAIDGMNHWVSTGRFQVVTCGKRWDEVRPAADAVKHHGPWTEAEGMESATSFARSMGSGYVRVVMLDGTTYDEPQAKHMEFSRVEVREVAPYLYSRHWGRLTPEMIAQVEAADRQEGN